MPLHSLTPLSDHALLGLWHLTEMPPALVELLPHSAHYAAQQPAVRDLTRQAQWLAGRALTHTLLRELTSAQSLLLNDSNGRPYLEQLPDFAVSLSHSGEWVAGIVSTQGRVGTDVELIRPKAQHLATRFLAETERVNAGDDVAKYSLYWSAKETLYKLHSRRGVVFKEQLLLNPFELREAGVLTGHLLLENFRSEHRISYQRLASDYVLTYCVEDAMHG
ncbi:siderophore biosynthesis protein [Hymenobacter qilianensis]|uniref:Siderophore biosynthesis protein n=2 Tax=Hymenobacter qilianensis TaxID=1385715 RepID=A0ACB5PLF8_9BACT|nr:4'-phosphopantetheinyl transferase family protein [Hymenobacter qilianensis]QNP50837.1 4'-phosphopantetheinyl transferase superfamily protein [Hymenobacter qilianensis]GGF50346.1 siderophore biosynthesis protein [Hymenobacter qilianensis]